LAGKLLYNLYQMRRLSQSGINDIDKMDGKTFEKYLEVLFKKLGYRVERTRYVGDYGADLVVWKNGIKTVIQAKRYKNKVGVKAIQEAVAAKGYYQCDEAMVVTNSFYTKQAEKLAQANEVKLWNRDDLVRELLSVKNIQEVEPSTLEASATLETEPQPEHEEIDGQDICVVCGQPVSQKIKQYCLDHSERFEGKIYCFQHQKGVRV
ncbi:MAG: restriction endonuclease, partial [Syntrophomonadaceae bacterium]|nr:restriction endonuclease [Syntrophomonadaceae bacterium]